jgi:hypothetical protein
METWWALAVSREVPRLLDIWRHVKGVIGENSQLHLLIVDGIYIDIFTLFFFS